MFISKIEYKIKNSYFGTRFASIGNSFFAEIMNKSYVELCKQTESIQSSIFNI